MIVTLTDSKPEDQTLDWHRRFLRLVPAIRRAANFRFRTLSAYRRREIVDDVLGMCCAFFARLAEKGQEERGYPTTLVQFAVAQLRQGRQVGSPLNVRDISSRYSQQKKGLQLERLDQLDEAEQTWKEVLLEDRRATPADLAASRIDFAAWLAMMSPLRRQIAEFLSLGESTRAAARRFALSPGRISQLRREFHASWSAFQGESDAALAVA
jgi:hypothetical protein